MYSEKEREKAIASFKDKKSIDQRARRRVDNIVRHVEPHLDKFSEEDSAEWAKLLAMAWDDDTAIEDLYSAEKLLDAPGAIYKDIELYHYTGKRKRSNESIRTNDQWENIKKTWKMLQRCTVVNPQLRALAAKYNIHIPTLVEMAAERKGKRKAQPAVEMPQNVSAESSKRPKIMKQWNDAKIPIIRHNFGHGYRQRVIVEDNSFTRCQLRYELAETVYVDEEDTTETGQTNTDAPEVAEDAEEQAEGDL
jgi:hypothetical protein